MGVFGLLSVLHCCDLSVLFTVIKHHSFTNIVLHVFHISVILKIQNSVSITV